MKNNNFTSYCFHTTTIMTTSVGGHLLQSNPFLLTGPQVHFPEPSTRLEHDAQIVIVHQRGRSQRHRYSYCLALGSRLFLPHTI